MLGVFAEFETNLRRERQLIGIARAKANGAYAGKGRPASIDVSRIREMKAQGLGPHGHRQGAWHRSGERLSGAVISLAPNRFKDFWRE
jgi:DNA invertase Pin-like site-specific DNA recombinase